MFNIAITGVGGGVGQSILKSLANTDYNLVALDGESLGAGLYVTNKSYLIPYVKDPNYINRLLEICEKEKIDLLFPGLDAELMSLSLHREAFNAIGTTVVVSDPRVITISNNKQETYNQLVKAGVNLPPTYNALNFSPKLEDFPLILKPKLDGARSKNIFVLKNVNEWKSIVEKMGDAIPDFIVMEYIEGDEYTCGSINLENSCKGIIVMRRILRDGDTYKCFVEKNEIIEKEVRLVLETIKPFGACNVQLRLRNGIPYVFEINARCSGTTAARTLSGFNEPKMIADYLLKGIEPIFEIKEQTILRYWQEMVVENQTINELKEKSVLNQNKSFNL